MIIDIHPIAASASWPAQVEAICAAEQAGFGSAWLVDHLGGGAFGGSSVIEAFTQVGYLAAVTRRLGLGLLVANAGNRSSGLLAASVASAQQVTGGRFVLGLGAGTSPSSPFAAEQHAVGQRVLPTVAERHAHLEQMLTDVRRIWSSPDAHAAGIAAPDPIPPVVIGVNSVRLAALAGRVADGVNVRWNHPDRAAILRAALDARGEREVGRWWTTSVWAPFDVALCDPEHPLRVQLAAEGVDRLALMWVEPPPLADIERAGRQLR